MTESGDMSWEDRIAKDFVRMTVQDDETGECWPVSMNSPLVGECPTSTKFTCSSVSSLKKWKIPLEYSHLGSSSCQEKAEATPLLENKTEDSGTWTCEKEEEAGETVLVAKFPPVGKVPLFGRKRSRPSPSTLADSDATTRQCLTADRSTRTKRFLEGRGGFVFLGRLILACLILLSPGYVLPLLFTIRTYCHMWKHSSVGDQAEEDIIDSNIHVFGFLRSRAFLKYSCRFCRERIQAQKMLRLHANMYGSSSAKFSSQAPAVEEESYACNCPNH